MFCFVLMLCFSNVVLHRTVSTNSYVPSDAIRAAQKEFEDNRYGLFIHWGPSSLLGAGEWVMQQP